MKNGKHDAQEILIETGIHLGREHAHAGERFGSHWLKHIQKSREMILKGAERVVARDSVTVLGAGAAYNIPLEELAREFNVVRLIDIDGEGLQRAVDGLAFELRNKVDVHVADATGGLALRLLDLALEIVGASADAEEALRRLIPLFNGQEPTVTIPTDSVEPWNASYIISSGLSSQSTIFPEKAVVKAYGEKFGVELEGDFFFKSGSSRLRNEWVHRHGELLAASVLPGGRVYWADTVAETPCLSQAGDRYLTAVVDSVVRFLERTYLKTFLTEAGKQVMAERFAQGTDVRQQSDQLLRFFNDKLDPDSKRRMAWAIMTLAGEGLITPNKELELLEYVIREAERISSVARQPILNGRLSSFFPSDLEPDGAPDSWTWINDPEATITLTGSTFYVDAHILKPRVEL